ncbi:MAG: alpha/beta fold hydrolase [Betaproteobacteria bacterium]
MCSDDREEWGFGALKLCYGKCQPGFHGFGASCWQTCRPGFTDIGLFCTNLHVFGKDSYHRGGGEAMSCKPGTWQDGLLCYPGCRDGYYGVGPVCWQHCPPGTDTDFGLFCVRWPKIVGWNGWWIFKWPIIDWGWMHWKHSYGRGWGEPLNHCKPGTWQSGLLCYPGCRQGYSGVLDRCWQQCPGGYTDDGLTCRRDNGYAKQMYFRDAGVPINYCPDYARNTHYPIILVHGWLGFDTFRFLGGGPVMEYFHDVAPHMRSGSRGATVFNAQVAPVASTETRGDQLLAFVQKVIKETGKPRVHLIGHSHGASTSRYVASVAPQLVASVTSVSGVNHAVQLGDLLLEIDAWDVSGRPAGHGWLKEWGDLLGKLVNWAAYNDINKYPVDSINPLKSFSVPGMKLFNWMHPWGLANFTKGQGRDWDSPLGFVSPPSPEALAEIKALKDQGKKGVEELLRRASTQHPIKRLDQQYPVLYYSWGGNQPFSSVGGGTPLSLSILDNIMRARGGEPGDGFVERSAARLGKMLGYYEQDHFVTANIAPSMINLSVLWGKAHPISLYCEHAHRLWKAEKDLLGLSAAGVPATFDRVTVDAHGRPQSVPLMADPVDTNQFMVEKNLARIASWPEQIRRDITADECLSDCRSKTWCSQFTYFHEHRACYMNSTQSLSYGFFIEHRQGVDSYLRNTSSNQPRRPAVSRADKKAWQWQCVPEIVGPSTGGMHTPVRLNDMGDVEAISQDGRHPIWKANEDDCRGLADHPPSQVMPLTCGSAHRAVWGGTGYDTEGHWCKFGRDRLNDWQCRPFGSKFAPMRKNAQGDVQALSKNAYNVEAFDKPELCLQAIHQRPGDLNPVTCGEAHKRQFGITGYENPDHWCARNLDLK